MSSLIKQMKAYRQGPTKTKLADILILLCQSELWMPMTILPKTGIKKVPDEFLKEDRSYIPLFTDRKAIKDSYYDEFLGTCVYSGSCGSIQCLCD